MEYLGGQSSSEKTQGTNHVWCHLELDHTNARQFVVDNKIQELL